MEIKKEFLYRYAGFYEQFFLVMIDEFQNFHTCIYHNAERKGEPDERIPASFHEHSESKIAPMLVTGSKVGWLVNVIDRYLEAGRLKKIEFSPYLTEKEGLEAVYRYSRYYGELEGKTSLVTNETAVILNQLCQHDPFFISCEFGANTLIEI